MVTEAAPEPVATPPKRGRKPKTAEEKEPVKSPGGGKGRKRKIADGKFLFFHLFEFWR